MNIISHITVDKKIIELRDNFVIIDRDVAELYGVEQKVRQIIEELGGEMPENLPKPSKSIQTIEKEKMKLENMEED